MLHSKMEGASIPDELKKTMLDFTIAYVYEKPSDIDEFALDFFTKADQKRASSSSQENGPLPPRVQDFAEATRDLNLDQRAIDWIFHFSVNYMLTNPPDLISFGINYTEEKIQEQKTTENPSH